MSEAMKHWMRSRVAGAFQIASTSASGGPGHEHGRGTAAGIHSVRSAEAVRMLAAQPAGSIAPATAITAPASASAASSHPW